MKVLTDGGVINHPDYTKDFISIAVDVVIGSNLVKLYTYLTIEDADYFIKGNPLAKEGLVNFVWCSLLKEDVRFASLKQTSSSISSKLFSVSDITSIILWGATLNYRKEGEVTYSELDLRWDYD